MWSASPSATYLMQFCRLGHQAMWVWRVKKVCEMWQSDLERGGDGDSRHTCDKTDKHMHTPLVFQMYFPIDENSIRPTWYFGAWWQATSLSRTFSYFFIIAEDWLERSLGGSDVVVLIFRDWGGGWPRALQGSHIIYLGLGTGKVRSVLNLWPHSLLLMFLRTE